MEVTDRRKKITSRKDKRISEDQEIERLQELIKNHDLSSDLRHFNQLPLSKHTLEGLKKTNYFELSEIQKATLPLSLTGKDVLGAAKTGSGKTLAFLIPVLECLYKNKWTHMDGVGAIIISPIRELALQIFDVLRKIGHCHSFSAGLVIGGKNLSEEKERVNRMNILVCTPGRLLQHMDQTLGFDCSNLQMLVLDEADRILDMGFEKTINAIIENLPKDRQTLLFSATQTKSVRDLVRLSLKDAEYVAVHEKAEHSTPLKLEQHYVVCELYEKLDILYSFIKTHLNSKIVIFVSSCKQVRFLYESFRRMRPGVPLMSLYGKQNQHKRIAIFYDFCKKQHAILFATDIAARGLDFPAVDWVVQLDCPDDGETYIHRVGRTARYESKGQSLIFLLPSEEEVMLEVLEQKKVPIRKIKINPQKTQSVQKQLEAFCSQDPELKYLAQKAFVTYLRSVFLHKNKKIFDVTKLPCEKFASSLGLPGAPKIKFIRKAKALKNAPRSFSNIESGIEDRSMVQAHDNDQSCKNHVADIQLDTESIKVKPKTKVDKMFSKKNQDVLSDRYAKLRASDDEEKVVNNISDDDSEVLKIKRHNHELEISDMKVTLDKLSKKDMMKMKLKHRLKHGTLPDKIVFDEEGNARKAWELESSEQFFKNDVKYKTDIFLQKSKEVMKEEDVLDKELEKQRLHEKKLKRKRREKEVRRGEQNIGECQLAVSGDADSDHTVELSDEYQEQPVNFLDNDFEVHFKDENQKMSNLGHKVTKQDSNRNKKAKSEIGVLEDQEKLVVQLLRQ